MQGDGHVDGNRVLADTAFGAVTGGVGGGIAGSYQSGRAAEAFGDPNAKAIFRSDPGARTGAAMGTAADSSLQIVGTALQEKEKKKQ